jgi:Cu/Ag efflux protein CusF
VADGHVAGRSWEKIMRRTIRLAAAAAALTLVTMSAAWAQAAKPVHLRGTIEKVDGGTLSVKLRDGTATTVKLPDNPRITAMTKAQLSDIKQGSFIGVTAMPQPDGSQKATGLHIFMDAQRGVVPSGHTPWDREPGGTMTNADVESTVTGVDGQTIMVKYKDGDKKVIVPPNTPVVRFNPGNKDDLKPGAQFFIVAATKQADGSFTAPAINVGRDGAVPPM